MMRLLYLICAVITGMVAWTITHHWVWVLLCFIFWPVAWVYWLVTHQVNLSIIKETFPWFFK
jgi:hypothetical protein